MSADMKGFGDLARYLDALPANLQRNALSAGLRAGARVVRDEARAKAPRDTGVTAKNIRIGSVHRDRSNGRLSISVRVTGKDSFHAYFQEYGVKAHLISRKKRKVAGAVSVGPLKIGDDFIGGTIHHPGHSARPFMRPALDTKVSEVVDAMRERVADWFAGKTGFNPLEGGEE